MPIKWKFSHHEDFFSSYLPTDSGFLQQVLLYLGSLYCSSLVEMNIDVLPKTRRIVIADCFSISKSCGRKHRQP